MNFSMRQLPLGRALNKGRIRLTVTAVQAKGPKGRTPGQPEVPDPFDRHSSARDKAAANTAHNRANVSRAGSSFAPTNRRRGRPAHLRSPDDSPLRDGNRDRLIGMLTERAAKTLLVYLQETNPTVYHWLFCYLKENPIPQAGTWDEVSGEMFLRKMLSLPTGWTKMDIGRDELFDNIGSTGVDPRQMAQRIMEIRVQLSKEFIQDLTLLPDENSVLLRETLQVSLSNALETDPVRNLPPRDTSKVFVHPELLQDGALHPEVAASHPELLPVVRDQAAKQQQKSDATTATSSPSPAPRTPSPTPTPPSPSVSSTPTPAPVSKPTIASTGGSTTSTIARTTNTSTASLKPDVPEPPQPSAEGGNKVQDNTPRRPPTKPWSPKDVPGLYNSRDDRV